MNKTTVSPVEVPDPEAQALAAHQLQRFYLADVDRLLALVREAEYLIGSPAPDVIDWVHDARQFLHDCHELGAAASASYMLAEHWRRLER